MTESPAWRGLWRRIMHRCGKLFTAFDRRLGGRLSLIQRTWQASRDDEVPLQARSIAYFALFSLFPLLLFLMSLSSWVLDSQEAQQAVLSAVEGYVPGSQDFVRGNIDRVLRSRGTAGVVGLVGLIWAGSGVFGAIFRGVNRAWGSPARRPIPIDRLFGLTVVLGLGLILVAMMLSSTVLELMRSWRVTISGWQPFADPTVRFLMSWVSIGLQAAATMLLFALLYRTVPRAAVEWRDVWPGAIAAGLAWEVAKRFFAWYLVSAARYNLVYGSVGAIIGFLLWSYASAMILLLGAEFTAQYGHWRRVRRPVEAVPPG